MKKMIMCAVISIAAFGLIGCMEEDEDVPNVTVVFSNITSDYNVESVSVGSGKVDNLAPKTTATRKIYSGSYVVKFTAGGVIIDATKEFHFQENQTYYVQVSNNEGSVKWTIFAAANSSALVKGELSGSAESVGTMETVDETDVSAQSE